MEFKRYKLGDLGEICMCKRIMKSETSETGDVPFFKIGTFGQEPDVYISRSLFEEYKNKYSFPKVGDILISAAGTIGRAVIYKGEDAYFQDSNIVWIDNDGEKVINQYLFYLYKNIKWKVSTGSTILRLYNDNIRETEIVVPEKNNQLKISKFLSILDKKIALNTRMNAELEAMAKQLYDYWFVQFDFPDENGKPYKSSGGKMVWNEKLKREIPEGWKVSTYGDVFDVKIGGTPSTTEKGFWENGTIHWLNSGEVQNFPVNDSEKKITKLAIKNSSTEFLPRGSVLISITRYLRVTVLNIDACINQSVAGFAETDDYKYAYTYFSLSAEVPRLMALRSGAQQPHINKETVENTPLLLPPLTVLKDYYKNANPLFSLLIKKSEETKKLTHFRDTLLPMLMNGQVTIE